MTNATDYTKAMNDFLGAFPVDMSAYQDAFKSSAEMGEKLSTIALAAAEKSTEVSTKWTQDTIARLGTASKAPADPADYSKNVTDYASASAENAAENVAAFAEIAKRVQMETVDLLMAAGRSAGEEATTAMKKASGEVVKASKKVAATAK